MKDDSAVTDEIDCLKAENRLLRAALEAQRRFKHDLAICQCSGCVETRDILGVALPVRDAGPTPFGGRVTDRSRT